MFEIYKPVVQCVQNQIQMANDEDYLVELNNLHVGLIDIQPMDIYNHIINCYAKIDLKMAEDNCKQFNESMDPTKPLAVYTKMQECC